MDGTAVNLSTGTSALTVNVNLAAALGTLAQVTVGSSNTLNLGAAQQFGSLAGGGNVTGAFALTLGNPAMATSPNTDFSGVIGIGAGTLIKNGKGTQTLSGAAANTFTGATTVANGTLALNKTAGINAIGGALNIGLAATLGAAPVVRLDASNQIIDTAALTMLAGSTFNLNGFSETITNIATMNAASIAGPGTLALSATGTTTATGLSSIGSDLQISVGTSVTRTLTMTGSADVLTVSGNITQGTAAGILIKAGVGTLVLSGSNSYAGATTVSAGILNIRNAGALGTVAGATTLTAGATLQLQGDITTLAEGLTVNGTGFAGAGG